MTAQAIPTLHLAASLPSIPPRSIVTLDDDDVSVTVTFRPCSPIGSTEVVTSLDGLDDTALLNLVDSAIARLSAYHAAYQHAMTEDADPAPIFALLPLPVPWDAW